MKFKTIFYSIILLLLSACIKDPCEGVFCSFKGECINGTCFCEEKYVGDNCVSYAQYFSGSYQTNATCKDTLYTTSIRIHNNQLDSVSISNFLNVDWQLIGRVINDSVVSIKKHGVFKDTINSISYEIVEPFKIEGKPKDTLKTTFAYNVNGKDSICTLHYFNTP